MKSAICFPGGSCSLALTGFLATVLGSISLKRSAGRSKRRKADSYHSAMSMLTFYVNRGGKNISASRKLQKH